MRKKEVRAAIVLALLAVALWVGYALCSSSLTDILLGESRGEEIEGGLESTVPSGPTYHWYAQGEVASLDSSDNPDLPFSGTMNVIVEETRLYRSYEDTGLPHEGPGVSEFLGSRKGANTAFFVTRVRFENVDAAPTQETRLGNRLFPMLELSVPSPEHGTFGGSLEYFDGNASEDDAEAGYFELGFGESATYTAAFSVSLTGGELPGEQVELHWPGGCIFILDVEDVMV